MSNNNRVIWADQVKAFAIWTMVLGHVGLQNQNIMDLIFIFHVPVFFIISGYFDKGIDISKAVVVKNFKSLLIPYFFFSIMAFSYCWISPYLHPELYYNGTLFQTFLKAFVGLFLMDDISRSYAFLPLGPVWFLVSLFWTRLLFSVCVTVWRSKRWVIIFIIAACILSVYYKRPSFFSLDSACMALPLYICGYCIKKFKVLERLQGKFLCILISIIGLLYTYFIGLLNGRVNMDATSFGSSAIMFYINAIVASISLIMFAKTINIRSTIIGKIGASTITILGTHMAVIIVFKVLGSILFAYNPSSLPLWYALTTSVAALTIGYIIHVFLSKRFPAAIGH